MVQVPTKANGNTVSAGEWNQLPDELENVVTASGQTPSSGTVDQVAKGVTDISANSDYYTDSGSVDAYVLGVIAPNKAPTSYRNGMKVRFRTTNPNTGASTINVAGLGIKNIKLQDGTTNPSAGAISAINENELKYDGTVFRLTSVLTATTTVKGIALLPKITILTNNSVDPNNDIDFSASVFDFDDGSGQASVTALTKQLDALWVAGNNQGGLDSGAKAIDTWYYCFGIYNPSTNISDFLFSTSLVSPVLPSGYTQSGLVGAIRTDGSGNILGFTHTDDEWFLYDVPITDISGSQSTTATLYTLSCPSGRKCRVAANVGFQKIGANQYGELYLSSPDSADLVVAGHLTNPGTTSTNQDAGGNAEYGGQVGHILTNTSSQVRARASSLLNTFTLFTLGFKILN
jgi:hypothetical protein